MKPIRIALVDDHALFRKGMIALLEDDERLSVAFEADSGVELFEKIAQDVPDLILMDLEMPGMDGMEATEKIRQEYPQVKVIAMTMHEEERFINRIMEKGASAYLLKNSDMGEVEVAILSVMETGFYFNDRVSQAMLGALINKNQVKATFDELDPLTDREIEVLKGVCEELSSEEIADKLHLSPRTVEGYRRKLLEKSAEFSGVGGVCGEAWVLYD